MNPLQERIKELVEYSKMEYPDTPDWYIQVAVESYIKNHEPELLQFEVDEKPEENKIATTIEEVSDETHQ